MRGDGMTMVRWPAGWVTRGAGLALTGIFLVSAAVGSAAEPDRETRRTIERALKKLEAPEPRTRERGVDDLARLGAAAASTVPRLLKVLAGDESPLVRRWTARALGEIGAQPETVVPALLKAFQKEEGLAQKRLRAAKWTPAMDRERDPWKIPQPIRKIKEEHNDVRWAALRAIGKFGPRAKKAIPQLAPLLRTPTFGRSAGRALGEIGAASVPVVLPLLKDPNDKIRLNAMVAFSLIGSEIPSRVAPALVRHLVDSHLHVQTRAGVARKKMGAAAAPALAAALADRNLRLRREAAEVLGEIGPQAAAAVPALAKLLKDSRVYLQEEAAEALAKVGPKARPAIPALLVALNDGLSERVRGYAARALAKIGPEADRAYPVLLKSFKRQRGWPRLCIIEALHGIRPGNKQALPLLIEALGDGDGRVTAAAAKALLGYGKESVPDLRRAAEDPALEPRARSRIRLELEKLRQRTQ